MRVASIQWKFQESGYGTCRGELCTLGHQYQQFLKACRQKASNIAFGKGLSVLGDLTGERDIPARLSPDCIFQPASWSGGKERWMRTKHRLDYYNMCRIVFTAGSIHQNGSQTGLTKQLQNDLTHSVNLT